jgi:amidase
VPTIAPKKGIADAEAPALRERIFRLTCIAPMLGFPEVTLPLATVEGCPMGLSLLGPRGSDAMLLAAAALV